MAWRSGAEWRRNRKTLHSTQAGEGAVLFGVEASPASSAGTTRGRRGHCRKDLESLANPAKEKDYGDNSALQYGVTVGAEAAGAGAAHHFFSADTRVVFGVNALEIGLVELYDLGLQRAMIVTGWNQARADPVVWELLPRGFDLKWHSVSSEPSLSDVAEGAKLALEHRADCVVAMGGAAVIDAGKAIAAIAYADKDSAKAAGRLLAAASEPRETTAPEHGGEAGVGAEAEATGLAPLLGPVPLVAIPLVAGIGSEVTPVATIMDDHDPLEPVKVTVGFHDSAAAMPAPFMAIVEPRLMMRVPLEITWPGAFVALAGCLESYVAGRGFVPDLMRASSGCPDACRGIWVSADRCTKNGKTSRLQIAELRRQEDAYMDPAYHRRNRARRQTAAGADNPDRTGGGDDAGGDSGTRPSANDGSGSGSDGGGGGGGREKVYSDDYNDRACAVLLKYQRVAGFVLGAGEQDSSDTGRRRAGTNPGAAPSPEDIVEWLDERLLDKNVAPLYRTSLRPEHVQPVLETLLSGGGGGGDSRDGGEKAALLAFGGLGEAAVRSIVAGEAGRRDAGSSSGGEREKEVKGLSAEAAAVVSSMSGDGEGPLGREAPQTGPWQKK
ncbi:Similar to Iron-containing Alcohol Dehydrogenase [Ectocarpus siliculosus]|uniref:Similar to Iron-containing Alcohol Dehydrogenase n=1 Tax=Ectocarpus siliculosus TaxID=2880 RepID=D7FRP4_ECTSI|nr:Similar to Iron-containing Alcohol Dehydrogenase [Ectocarpus siliculosus]|eukprot:CBJ30835.1 Similar to Iron-containing Alcohol Dehydrogenase [Ectocarpus siliculosus]